MALIIDPKDLSEDALLGLIQSHITDGADAYQGNLADDTLRVKGLLANGTLLIIFSEEHETASIRHKDDVPIDLP